MEYPKALEDLIQAFQHYPGVGRKTAERYALFTVNQLDDTMVSNFSDALLQLKKAIHPCSICGHLTDVDPCVICSDPKRDQTKIIVLESAKDVFSIEKSGNYKGLYHVLNGVISPVNGVGPEDINFTSLVKRVHDDVVKEVILATSATQEGEATALYVNRVLKSTDLIVSRIAYGVPVGANLEYADEVTLTKAIENRRVY
ncbi:MAG: recombination mediator RecR [Candidatus Izemoplasmatales bacterium]|nr:recombination mediator RecR [bacterium]MDZ4197087.1 recombination mediator RecR [Candidatus Izemoplasmatales bacterium]